MESNPWIKCFSVVTFDEDIGQQVEYQTPPLMLDFQLQMLAFLAFPDSNAFSTQGDLFFVFKMKFSPNLYGYVYFRQVRNPSMPRKFFQKSLVLLSEHPYVSLFKQIVEIIGPLYFEHGNNIFEAVNSCMKNWPKMSAGCSLEFPILGVVVNYTVPSMDTNFTPQVMTEGLSDILESVNLGYPGLFQDINLCEIFGMNFVKKHLWAFWEILISGEELLFVTESPGTCSLGVLALVSLLSPLIYAGDLYPYFTIFDNDFKIVQNNYERKKSSDIVIGATNPYILKAFSEMANVFQCEGQYGLQVVYCKSTQNTLTNKILNLFEGNSRENFAINNSAIRKHFREMTMAFLKAFEEYYTFDQEAIFKAPYSVTPLKPFSESEFLSQLGNSKLILPFLKYTNKPRALSLYTKFIKSSTFSKWFATQRQKCGFEAEECIRKAAINFDMASVLPLSAKDRHYLLTKVQIRLITEEVRNEDPSNTEKLRNQLRLLITSTLS